MKAAVITVVVAVAALVVLGSSVYTVHETEQIIITQFGDPIGETITEPGLHFKTPFIQKVNRFDKRWLEWDGDADEMPTKEKTYIWVDMFARWRIVDALTFFQSVRDEYGAQTRLDDIIDSETRNVIASHNLIDVVRSSNRDFEIVDEDLKKETDRESEDVVETVTVGRSKLTRMILEKAKRAMPDFGIELVDVQLQRVNYTDSVRTKVFERMVSERKRIAARYRSEGEGQAARILGEKDRDLKRIESEAYRTVQEVKGKADAKATNIYAAAHNLDPHLYKLLESLDSYKATIDADSTLVLGTESDYFESLVDMGAR